MKVFEVKCPTNLRKWTEGLWMVSYQMGVVNWTQFYITVCPIKEQIHYFPHQFCKIIRITLPLFFLQIPEKKTSFTTWIFTKCVYSEIIKHLMICRGAQNSPPNSVVWYVMRLIFFRLGINESVQQQAYDYLNRTFLLIFKKAIEICFLW